MDINVLAGLLDEKLIRIMSLFLKHPEKKFYLSEVSKLSRVNTATTFRTLNKLVKEDFLKAVVIGKVRTYQLSNSERAKALAKLLKRDEPADAVTKFCERAKDIGRIKRIILDAKTGNTAKLLIIGDFPSKERLDRIVKEIKERYNFIITYVELNTTQYEGLRSTTMFSADKKVLFSRMTKRE